MMLYIAQPARSKSNIRTATEKLGTKGPFRCLYYQLPSPLSNSEQHTDQQDPVEYLYVSASILQVLTTRIDLS